MALSSLVNRDKSASSGDGILGQQVLAGRGNANNELAPSARTLADSVSNALLTGRITGAAAADAAIASALISNRGIFLVDPLATARGAQSEFSNVGKIVAAILNPNAATANTSSGAGNSGAAIPLATIRTTGISDTFIDSAGKTIRIDPITGQISCTTKEGRTNLHLSIAELEHIQRTLGERRYLTGVEIAIACAIASAAIAKSRNNQTGHAASSECTSLLEGVESKDDKSNKTNSKKHSLFKRPTYLVAVNDSLVEIAERIFNDARVAFLIADINAESIIEHFEDGKRIVELRARQEIELPLASEVEEFIIAHAEDANAENLVTVVSITAIDRELFDAIPSSKRSAAVLRHTDLPQLVISSEAQPQPLMQLVDFGTSFGRTLMPSVNAIISKGLNLTTYISKIDTVAPRPIAEVIEPQRTAIEVVAHDLRSPLMSSQASIDLVQELYIDLSDEAFDALQSAHINLAITIESARRLLNCARDLDKFEALELDDKILEQTHADGENSSNSSEQMTQIMSALSQEMRIPLRLALESLIHFEQLETPRLTDEVRAHLCRAQSGISRGMGLINDQVRMEHFFKNSICPQLDKSQCDIADLAADAMASLQSLADQKNIVLLNQCNAESVFADRGKISQVLINFLSNAIKFSPENTSIKITTKVLRNTIRIAVTDQGPGLDRQARSRVFEKYTQVRTSRNSRGHGLGLSICRLIAQSHGGKVGVTSEPGKGSSFWMEIPRDSVARNVFAGKEAFCH